jgi:hypothetical protein
MYTFFYTFLLAIYIYIYMIYDICACV